MRYAASLILLPFSLLAAESVEWERTPEVFAGKYVKVTLTGSTRIEGYWAAVTPDSFTFQVERSSNRREVAKGIQSIPRASIATIRAGKRYARGRVIGTIAGAYAVGLALYYGSGNEAAGAFGIYGGAALGYFLGRSYDHATIEYTIQDPPPVKPVSQDERPPGQPLAATRGAGPC